MYIEEIDQDLYYHQFINVPLFSSSLLHNERQIRVVVDLYNTAPNYVHLNVSFRLFGVDIFYIDNTN